MVRRRLAVTAALAAALAGAAPASAGAKGWDDAGSIARDALVVAALGVPVVQGDWNGALQAGGSIGATALVTYGLKESVPAWRPDRSDRKSFPSGHTSMAFSAAATLHNRYGWQVGLPAQIVAAFVGVSRVKADKHHWYDVVVGAAIGEAAGFLITRRRDDRVRIVPWGDSKSGGVAMAVRF
ncbi:phosphatase PAP2 family protein [Sphingomonas flavalba]|uniref:phosphatase PAP2 family protein n=1 Tax=Sphingomonas flavalba TaxID=2559804 RepID=UPI0039E12FB5